MTEIAETTTPFNAAALVQALTTSMDGPAVTALQRAMLESAFSRINVDTLVPDINAALNESVAKIVATFTPRMNEIVAQALANIDLSTLTPAINAAARDIIDRAAVLDALDNAGYRSALYKIADDHHGYVTTDLAKVLGIPPVEVRKLAARGGMTNIARGLYRVDGIDGGDRAAYQEAVLRVGDDAHLVADSVLAFHDLALVNPRYISVGTPRRVRRDLPAHIRLIQSHANPADLTAYDGIRSITVERAIRDSIGSVMPERLAEAIRRAADEGLVRRATAKALLAEIGTAA